MPTVVVLALTLALAPAPSPSTTPNLLGDIIGGVGQIVDDLLGGDAPSADPTPNATPTTPSVAPTGVPTSSQPPAADQPSPVTSIAIPVPAGSAGAVPAPSDPVRRTTGEDAGAREAAVPRRDGETPEPSVLPALANPTGGAWPPASYLLVVGLLALLAVLLLRRRAPAAALAPRPDPGPDSAPRPGPVLDSAPAPDPDLGPVPDNVSQLPTSLNVIYEMGRLDERLEQERRRRT
ncbi:hypothetical protein [Micromonospora violae]|uniref:hypothetical protein n=1 Tax=Micromonospora violae TaxID=1278207 RepID=UPI0033DAD641